MDSQESSELKLLGISAVDIVSLEQTIESEVEKVVSDHSKKQKLQIVKKELKEASLELKTLKNKQDEYEHMLEGKGRYWMNPHRYLSIEKSCAEVKNKINTILDREKYLKERLTLVESNELTIDQLIDDIDQTDDRKKEIADLTSMKTELDILVRGGNMTPFGTLMNFESVASKNLDLEKFNHSSSSQLCQEISNQSPSDTNLFASSKRENDDLENATELSKDGVISNENMSQNFVAKESGFSQFEKYLKDQMDQVGIKKRKLSLSHNTYGVAKKIRKRLKEFDRIEGSNSTSIGVTTKRKIYRRPVKDKQMISESDEEISDSDSAFVQSSHTSYESDASPIKNRKTLFKDDGDLATYRKRIKNWKKRMTGDDMGSFREIETGYKIPLTIWNKLYLYQKTGVHWLWELHCQGCGGIMGDEMGLGKTIQAISFLTGLSVSELYLPGQKFRGLGPVLIVCPSTLLHQWVKEFHDWWPSFRVAILHESGTYKGRRPSLIHHINRNAGILITSYMGLQDQLQVLLQYDWHYLILDEGHKIRNPEAQITVAVKRFNTPHRLILSGCPIQNSLKELWSLFDFVFPGKLGTLQVFMQEFSIPITQGGYANASKLEVQTAYRCAIILRDTINPYLLRRVKNDVKKHLTLPEKSEQVLFCGLTEEQLMLYKEYLGSNEVQLIMRGRMQVFVGLFNLRKMCNHPHLFVKHSDAKDGSSQQETYGWWEHSGKMRVLRSIMNLWKAQNHRVLLFTQSRQMLFILEKFIQQENYDYLKMDGSTNVGSRQHLIKRFNEDPSIFVFILTTRVGGLGVNLTGADRVVIYDPDWNPSTDTQARERAWRIGQTRDVTVYRLLTAGTIEEKIYHRQIFKQLITNRILKDPKQQRFFRSTDLYELFTLDEGAKGNTSSSALFAGTGSEVRLKAKKDKRLKNKRGSHIRDNLVLKSPNRRPVTSKHNINAIEGCELEGRADSDWNAGRDTVGKSAMNVADISASDALPESMSREVRGSDVNAGDISGYVSCASSGDLMSRAGSEDSFAGAVSVDASGATSGNLISRASSGNAFAIACSSDSVGDEVTNCDVLPVVIDDYKKKKMMDLAKLLSKKIGSNNSLDKLNKIGSKKFGKIYQDVRKGKKFEGERIEYLVKKRRWKTSKNEKETPTDNKAQNEFVLEMLFKKSGIHTALSHDRIVDSGESDYLLLETEAQRVASQALNHIRSSRNDYFSSLRGIIDEKDEKTLRFGNKNSSLFCGTESNTKSMSLQKEEIANHCTENSPVPFSGSSTSLSNDISSSSNLLKRIKERNQELEETADGTFESALSSADTSKNIYPELQNHLKLITDMRDFILSNSLSNDGITTKKIVSQFKSRLPPNQSHVFKELLKSICDFQKNISGQGEWFIRNEFR